MAMLEFDLIEIKCGYCDNLALQKVVAQYVHTTGGCYQDEIETYFVAGDEWALQMSLCALCDTVNFTVTDDGVNFTVLYPKSHINLQLLPGNVEKAYKAARAIRLIDANAFGVLLGRVLELVCIDRNAVGSTLYKQLKDLATKGEIPGPLADMAHQLRALRNFGAHAALGELTESEIPILDNLCEAILDYVYIAPNRVAEIAKHINELEKRNKKP